MLKRLSLLAAALALALVGAYQMANSSDTEDDQGTGKMRRGLRLVV